MSAGMFFCRHPDAVHRAFDVTTSYMPSKAGTTTVDPYLTTVQWSRRAIGLKVFMSLAERGREGLANQIDHQARMGDVLRSKLTQAGWIVVDVTLGGQERVLRACITSFRTNEDDLQCLVDEIEHARKARPSR
jgi:glutamate/tyrosine decarboxylase-like PLP-dependent enzyme